METLSFLDCEFNQQTLDSVLSAGVNRQVCDVCFFMVEKYQYRPDFHYVLGLDLLIKYLREMHPNVLLRVWCDSHRHKQLQDRYFAGKAVAIRSNSRGGKGKSGALQLILFDCPRMKQNNFHIGLFGTVIRFLSMFQKNAQLRVYTDADSDAFTLNGVSLLYMFNQQRRSNKPTAPKVDFSYVSYQNHTYYEGTTTLPYAIAGVMASASHVPISLLENFLNQTASRSQNVYANRNYHNQNKNLAINQQFGYGFDEVFINRVLIPYHLEMNNTIRVILLRHIAPILRADEVHIASLPQDIREWICNYYDYLCTHIIKTKPSKPEDPRRLENAIRAACRETYLFKHSLQSEVYNHFTLAVYKEIVKLPNVTRDNPEDAPRWTLPAVRELIDQNLLATVSYALYKGNIQIESKEVTRIVGSSLQEIIRKYKITAPQQTPPRFQANRNRVE